MDSQEDGLPGDAVYSILQSSDGFIWLVCNGGLARYDGISTRIYGSENTSYQGSTLYEMHEDSRGNYWLPTIGEGLVKFQDGDFTHYGKDQGLNSDIIKALAISHGDTVWIGTYGAGIQAFYGDTVVATYTTQNGLINNQVWRMIVDDQNRLWVGTNGGISILENGSFTNFTAKNGLPYNVIRGLTQMENGDVWVGTDKEGVVVFKNDKPTTYYNTDNGLNNDFPQYFAQNPADGSIWIANHGNGIDRFYNGTFEAMTAADGLVSDLSTFITFSKEGLAFIGSEAGVSILKKRKIDVVDEAQGLSEEFLINVNEDSSGTVWVGTEGKGFNYKTENGWGVIEYPTKLTNGYASGGAVDRDGNIWFNTKGTGTVKIEDYKIAASYSTENGLLADFARGLAFDQNNNAWIGTNDGVNVVHQNGEIESFTTENGLPHNFVMTAISASDGSIWVGTFGGGAARFKDGHISVFDTSNGLLTNKVYVLMEDSRGHIWMSGSYGGLSLFDGIEITNFTPEDGLPTPGFNALAEDDFGNLWLGDGGGIYKIKMQDLYDVKEGKSAFIPSVHYTTEDGFPSQTLDVGYSSTAIKQSNGDILFATNDGIAVIHPQKLSEPAPVISTYIDQIAVNGIPKNPDLPITIQPENNSLEITYSAFNFSAPSKTKFRVKLSGINNDWVQMGQRKTVYYDFLPDGEYTFQVAATNADGQWKSEVAELQFQVLPPFYKTWWFMGILILSFGGIIAGAVRIRYRIKVNKLNRELAVKQKLEKERERISRDLHDNVGSQITNLITGLEISNLHIKKNEKDQAISLLESLDADARSAMTELRETIWLLDQKKVKISTFETHLKGFIKRQNYALNGLKIHFESHLSNDNELEPTQSLHLLRIIQESLNNCRKYACATHFKITTIQKNGSIKIHLKDDGKGMNTDKCIGKGNGLKNIQRRVKEMDGALQIKSIPGKGTEIIISIPIIP